MTANEEMIRNILSILGKGLVSASSLNGVTWGDLYQGYVLHLCQFIDYMAESWGDEKELTGDVLLNELVKTLSFAYARGNEVEKDGV